MTLRPIDLQQVIAQQTNLSGQDAAQQAAGQVARDAEMKKKAEHAHERETQVEESSESNKITDQEKEKQRRGGSEQADKGQSGEPGGDETRNEPERGEDGVGGHFDATT